MSQRWTVDHAVNSAVEASGMYRAIFTHHSNQLPLALAFVSLGCVNFPLLKKTNDLEHPVKSKELQNADYFS